MFLESVNCVWLLIHNTEYTVACMQSLKAGIRTTLTIIKPGARPQPAVGTCQVSWNYFTKSVHVFVCMYICLSFRVHVSKPFAWSLKAACMQTIKAKQSLYYTHAQVSSPSKACFFPNQKPDPQTSKPAFPDNFSGVIQPKNSVLGLMGLQGMHISSFGKWAWPVFTRTKMKSSPKALLEEF